MPVTMAPQARTATSQARRSQIVAATIRVIAREGFAQASFAAITAEAGLSSTRLISYHFSDKRELVDAVFADVVSAMGTTVGTRVEAATSGTERLRAYIESVVDFTASHPAEMRTLLQIALAGALPSAAPESAGGASTHVEAILRDGQVTGEFRDFDPAVVAVAIQRSLEGLPFLLESDPDLDTAAYSSELATLLELGTRRS